MRSIYRAFKRQYHLSRDIYKEMDQTGSFTLKARFTPDSSQTELETPDPDLTMRFIMVMRRFLDSQDRIYYKAVWAALQEQFGEEVPEGMKVDIDAFITHLNKGSFPININGEDITAARIYEIIAEGARFNRLDHHVEFLKSLANIPMVGPLLWHQFYEFTIGTLVLASKLFDAISEVEKSFKYKETYGDPDKIVKKCIYCLTTEGSFKSEEHTVPEGMGNNDYVLPRGYVCDKCNHGVLSMLDRELAECILFAAQRIDAVQYTKDGRLPETRLGEITIKRTDPLNVSWIADPGSDAIKVRKVRDDGVTELSIKTTSAKPFDERLLARALCKIGLAAVALDFGQEYACSRRFDAARRFILEGGDFKNNLLLCTWMTMRTDIHLRYDHGPDIQGTPMGFSIYGVGLMMNLEEKPKASVTPLLKQLGFISFPLYGKKRRTKFQVRMVPPQQAA